MTDLSQLPAQANTASGGSFWVAMLYMLWVIFLLFFSTYGFELSILVSSFLCLIIGLLLVYAGLMAWGWCAFFVGILIIMFFYIMFSEKKYNRT